MKYIAFIPGILFLLVTLNSCCNISSKGGKRSVSGCSEGYYEKQSTEWVEEEVYVDSGAKGGKAGTTTVLRPVVTTTCKRIKCTGCGSWYYPSSGCCGTVSRNVLKRATAQGGTGEPHMGQIPTMKKLAP